MMAISTGGIGQVDISAGVKRRSKANDEQAVDAFSSLMNMAAVQNKTDSPKASSDTSNDSVVEDDNYSNSLTAGSRNNDDKIKSGMPEKSQRAADAADNISDYGDTADEELVSELLSDIRQKISEALGISGEELDGLLADMNLMLADMVDESALKSLLLQSQNATEVDMLINEQLADMISEITDMVAAIIEQYDISDISEIINDMPKFADANAVDGQENEDVGKHVVSDGEKPDVMMPFARDNFADGETASMEAGQDLDKAKVNTDVNVYDGSEDYDMKAFKESYNQVLTNLNNAIDNTVSDLVENIGELDGDIGQADIIRQIIDEIKVHISHDSTSMELQLNPEHLGRVQISVASKNGVMQAQILAETEAAKVAIENNLAMLKDAFRTQELKVEAVEVMVASYGFFRDGHDDGLEQQQKQTFSGSMKLKMNSLGLDEERSDEEKLEAEMMKANGNSVSYAI